MRSAVDCPITTSGAAPLIVDGFRRVRRSTFTEGAIMERAEYDRHSRARMAETAKDAPRHATPDAPERIDHRRRCTRHDHRTCCRGSCGSASLPRNAPSHFQGTCACALAGHKHQTGTIPASVLNFGIWANAEFEFPSAAEARRRSLDVEDLNRAFRV